MATVGFNPTKIRTTPSFQPHKPISAFFTSFSSKPTKKLPLNLSQSSANSIPSTRPLRGGSVSESSVSAPLQEEPGTVDDEEKEQEGEEDEDEDNDDPTAELCYLDPEADPETITGWEMDFCSRPILDIRGKKIWELVVCDRSLSLQFTKYFPNNVINSITLKDAIVSITDELGVPLPDKIRFFR